MKFAFVISLLLAAIVVRSPKDQANTGKSLTAVQPLAVKARPIADLAPPAAPTVPKTVYVVDAAYDEFGIESDYSPELATFYTNNQLSIVWDPSPILDLGGYNVYWGTNSGEYIRSSNAGTNLGASFQIASISAQTNYLRLFSQIATNPAGPWEDVSKLPMASITNAQTNGLPQLFWRIRVAVSNAP